MNNNLITCPVCRINGKPVILGSIDDQGNYYIILSHNRSIKVVGTNFGSYCTRCGELIYFKSIDKPQDLLRVQITTFVGTVGTVAGTN
jgi:hypothetical protein